MFDSSFACSAELDAMCHRECVRKHNVDLNKQCQLVRKLEINETKHEFAFVFFFCRDPHFHLSTLAIWADWARFEVELLACEVMATGAI